MERIHFLSIYSDDEKINYLSLVLSLAVIDHYFDPKEEIYLEELSDNLKLSPEGFRKITQHLSQSTEEILNTLKNFTNSLKNSDLRFTLISELSFIAISDKNFRSDKQTELYEIAKLVNVNEEQVNNIINFVEAVNLETNSGYTDQQMKQVGIELVTSLKSVGVPVESVSFSGSVSGVDEPDLKNLGSSSALGLGLGTGMSILVGFGYSGYEAVRGFFQKLKTN